MKSEPGVVAKQKRSSGRAGGRFVLDESIYDHPKYYDLVFGADCAAEVRFILQCGAGFLMSPAAAGPSSRWRLMEPACGTGRLMAAFARRGMSVRGLDLNPHAVAFCNARFAKHGWVDAGGPPAVVADMSRFDWTGQAPFDIAFNTINSFRHLGTEAAARAHLACMAAACRPGSLYLLGIHLTPTAARPSDGESWAARRGSLSIKTHMWTQSRDTRTRIERFGIRFDVDTPTRRLRINDVLVLRSYTMRQMNRLIVHGGQWEIAATYDFAYDIQSPIVVDASTEDVVYVLRRTDAAAKPPDAQ